VVDSESLGYEKTAWQIHAYCLMGNHFHLVVETPQANLVAGMKWLLGTYTSRYNRHHKEFGHLFSGRYKALMVDGSGNGYLKTVGDYVHLNPARAGLLEQVSARPGPSHFGPAIQEAAEAVAERLVAAGLKRLAWTGEELASRRKGDSAKLKLAQELRRKTTVFIAWIAQRLCMGSRGYLAWLLQQQKRRERLPKLKALK